MTSLGASNQTACCDRHVGWADAPSCEDEQDLAEDLATELAKRGLRACCGLPGDVHCR